MKVLSFAAIGIMWVVSAMGVSAQEAEKVRMISGGVLNGKAVSLPKPDYPAHLRDQGIGGTVSVEVEIDESGMVVSAKAKNSITKKDDDGTTADKIETNLALVEAAEAAARQAQFSPTFLNGEPVRIKGTVVYNFVPNKKSSNDSFNGVSGGVLNGKAVELPPPAYPAAAKAVKAEGTVNVAVVIDEDGNVVESEAISGHPLLRAAAVNASRNAKFSPTLMNGQPVRVRGVVVYNFVF